MNLMEILFWRSYVTKNNCVQEELTLVEHLLCARHCAKYFT
jgi:hypothetical protein